MLKLFRLLLVALWLTEAVSSAQGDLAAENRAFKEAQSAFEDTNWERAQREFATFVEKFPLSALATEAVLYRAQALLQLGRFGESIPLLEERKATAGNQTDTFLYYLGEARLLSRDFAAAAGAFSELSQKFPDSAYRFKAEVGEAEARARLGDWRRVIELLGNPAGIFQQTATSNSVGSLEVRGKFLYARATLELGDLPAAMATVQSLSTAILSPEQAWLRQQLLARIALKLERTDEAERQSTNLVLLAGLTARPDLAAESWALRGLIFERLGQPDKAIEAYSQNLASSAPIERQREALGKLAEIHLGRGELAEAARKLDGFLERSTNSSAADIALLALAEVHLKQHVARTTTTNHLAVALALLDRLVTGSPQSPLLGQAQFDRGWCFWLSNQPALSRAAFKEAAARLTEAEPLAIAHFKLGDAAYALQDFADARENYRLALDTLRATTATNAAMVALAWYQMERACLALGDAAGAEVAMRQLLDASPIPPTAEGGLLLAAQGYTEANQPEQAAALFAEFTRRFPASGLRPEVELAAARGAEFQGDWMRAERLYTSWRERFTNHARLPDVEFHRALVLARLGQETNTYALLTNFVAVYPTNALAQAAQYWLGDQAFRAGDFADAEKHYSLLYHYWPKSELAPDACMMAGRAAVGWSGYANAINHFTNLTSNPNCPDELRSPARFAYGYALRLLEEVNPTNRIANLKLAAGVFGVIHQENPNTEVAAEALGEIGNTYYQLGSLDTQYYPLALEAYRQARSVEMASQATRGQAGVGCGKVAEKLAPPGTPEARDALRTAFNDYLDVLYDESGDAIWRGKAGQEAIRVGRELGEWTQVEQLCIRMQKLFPPLHASLEKRRLEAGEKARASRNANGDADQN